MCRPITKSTNKSGKLLLPASITFLAQTCPPPQGHQCTSCSPTCGTPALPAPPDMDTRFPVDANFSSPGCCVPPQGDLARAGPTPGELVAQDCPRAGRGEPAEPSPKVKVCKPLAPRLLKTPQGCSISLTGPQLS
jgi:hypothetical protein